MRTILRLSAVVVLAAACAPRPHPYPVEAPYLLRVPAPGTDYRYRSGPQGFGRTGPVYASGPAHGPYGPGPGYAGHEGYQGPPPGYGEYDYGHEAYGEGPHVRGYSDGYSWGDRRHSVRGGSSYESREMMTEESYFEGGVIVEREASQAPRGPEYGPYPGPYAQSPRFGPSPYAAPPAGPPPVQQPDPRQPYPDAGPEPFY